VKKRILFIFRENFLRGEYIKTPDKNPDEFFYGYNHIKSKNIDLISLSRKINNKDGFRKINKYCEYCFYRLFGFPIDFHNTLISKKDINNYQIAISVIDSVSMGLLFWKLTRKINATAIVLVQNLPDLVIDMSWIRKYAVKIIIRKAHRILVLSDQAKEILVANFDINPKKIIVFRFGVDKIFWKREKIRKKEKYILSVGKD